MKRHPRHIEPLRKDTMSTPGDATQAINAEKPVSLNSGLIIGVTAAVIIIVIGVVFGVAYHMRRKRQKAAKANSKNAIALEDGLR